MIEETITYSCRSCGSRQYLCKVCGACRVLRPKVQYIPEQKEMVLKAYRERMSLRGLQLKPMATVPFSPTNSIPTI